MAKNKTIFVCNNCGYESPKWMGKCPACNEWNSFSEEKVINTKDTNYGKLSKENLNYIIDKLKETIKL